MNPQQVETLLTARIGRTPSKSPHGAWLLAEKALHGIRLPYADLQGANLRRSDVRGADLRGVNLRGAHLVSTDFRGADLTDADLRGAILHGADFGGAELTGAKFGSSFAVGAVIEIEDLQGEESVSNEETTKAATEPDDVEVEVFSEDATIRDLLKELLNAQDGIAAVTHDPILYPGEVAATKPHPDFIVVFGEQRLRRERLTRPYERYILVGGLPEGVVDGSFKDGVVNFSPKGGWLPLAERLARYMKHNHGGPFLSNSPEALRIMEMLGIDPSRLTKAVVTFDKDDAVRIQTEGLAYNE